LQIAGTIINGIVPQLPEIERAKNIKAEKEEF
jgi:hypothetical protein